METEFEVKFYPIIKNDLRAKLKELGAELILTESLMKIAIFGKESNKDMKVDYIRVRDEKSKITMSAKVHAREGEEIAAQKETVIEVTSFEDTISILKLAGLQMDNEQEKYREVWNFRDTEIVIDTWPMLKPLMEIEGESEATVKQVSDLLELDWSKRIFTSITEIYAKEQNISFQESLKFTRSLKFNPNHLTT